MKKNVLLIHGTKGVITFKDRLIQDSDQNKLRFIAPAFPTIEKNGGTYSDWRRILDKLAQEGTLDKESTVIAHSLGTIALIKFITENNLKLDKYISVSGFLSKLHPGFKNTVKENVMKLFGFSLKEKNLQDASGLITKRHSFISDNDHLIPEHELLRYAKLLSAQVHYPKGYGHFSRTNNVTHIPGLAELVND